MTPGKTDARSAAPQSNFEALAEEQRSLAEIGRIVSSTLNLDQALSAFVEQTRPLVPFDRIVINVVNDDLTEFRDVFVDDAREDAPPERDYLPYNSTTLAREALENQAEFVANGRDYQTYLEQVHPEQKQKNISGFNSLLLIPLIWQGKAIGTLNLRSTKADSYNDPEIELAKQIGAQIAGAIANFSQRKAIDKELEDRRILIDEQARISEIGRIIASTLDINEVFDVFAEHAQHLVPWDRIIVAAISEDRSHLIDSFIAGVDVNGRRPPLGALERDEVFIRIFNEKKQFLELNQAVTSDLPPGIRRTEALKAGLKSMLVTPLLWKGEVAGVLTFRSIDPAAYNDHHADLALQISQQIAGHIATADQYAAVERESSERRRLADEQRRIAEIGRIVSSTLEIDEVFESFAEQVGALVSFDRIVIASVSEDRTALIDQFVAGFQMENSGPGKRIPLEKNDVYERVFVEKKPFLGVQQTMKDYVDSSPVEQPRFDAGLRSMLVTPLIWKGEVEGVLTFRSSQYDAFGEHEVDLALQISQQVAGAIATADQYAAVERESEERQRLAAEQSRIAEIGRIVSSSLDVQEVLAAFVEQARELVPIDRIVFTAVNDDMTTVTDIHKAGIGVLPDQPIISYPFLHTPVQANVMSTQTTFVANGDDYDKYVTGEVFEVQRKAEGIRAILIVPLVWQGRCFGTMNLRSTNPEAYDAHEIELSEQIGAQVAGAISTTNQYSIVERESQERQRLAEEQSRIAEIGRIVSSSLDVQEVLAAFVEQARELVPFDGLTVLTVDEDRTSVVDAYKYGISGSDRTIGQVSSIISGSWIDQIVTSGGNHVLREDDYLRHAEAEATEGKRYEVGLRSLLALPLIWQGQAIGVVVFRSRLPTAYEDRDISLAKQICAQIAGAIATADQYAMVERESGQRQRLAEEQSRIAEIGRIVSSSLDVQEVLEAFVEQAQALVPIDRIVITATDSDQGTIADILVDGVDITEDSVPKIHRLDDDPIHYDAIINQSIYLATGDEYIALANGNPGESARLKQGLRSLLIVPLVWKDRCFGTMNLRSTDTDAYGKHEVELAEQIGAQIAGAFSASNQVRLLEAAATAAQTQAAALEAAGDAIVIRGLDTRIEYANKAFETQTGYTVEEVIGQDPDYQQPGVSLPSDFVDRMWEQVRSGRSVQTAFVGTHKNGTQREYDATLSPIFDEEGKIIKFVGIRRDVTDRVRAEDDIRTQAAALNAMGDSVVILKPDTSIEWVNEAFIRSSGYSREEAIGQSAPFMRSDKNSDELFDGLWERVLSGKPWIGRTWVRRKNGTDYQAESSLTPVLDENGNLSRIVGIRRDITDVVQAEKDREATRDLDAQNQQLVHLNEQREEFFSTVSHELRTPLTAVMAFADILTRNRDGTLSNLQLEHLDVIKRNSKNLNALVEDMLDFSRLSTDRLKLDKSEFEVHSLLDSIVESLEPTAMQREQSLAIEPHASPIWITADSGRINQVISNLITNSCKYSPASTRISLSVDIRDQQLQITVSDQGYGIPEDDLEEIFSPFFRADQTAIRQEVGTGLGLAISKTLVDLHNGTIEAASTLGEGTTVTVILPGASSSPTRSTPGES